MFKFSQCSRCALLAVFLVAGAILPTQAASFTAFKGAYGGHFTGVFTIAQGSSVRLIGSAATTVKASRKTAKFIVKGTLNNTGYIQTITLGAHGQAVISSLIPGGSDVFQNSATGTYRVHGKRAALSFTNPGGLSGSMTMRISFINGGSTLAVSSIIRLSSGDSVYTTIIGS